METYNQLKKFLKQFSVVLILVSSLILFIDFSYGLLLLTIIGNLFYVLLVLHLIKSNKPKEIKREIPLEQEVFNVENFNQWFIDPNNCAEYAHLGIFLRLDKLSESHIQDYLYKQYAIDNDAFMWSKTRHEMYSEFLEEIKKDWTIRKNVI